VLGSLLCIPSYSLYCIFDFISAHMLSCYPNYMPSIRNVELQLEWLQWLRSDCWCVNLRMRQSTCACIPGIRDSMGGEFTGAGPLSS